MLLCRYESYPTDVSLADCIPIICKLISCSGTYANFTATEEFLEFYNLIQHRVIDVLSIADNIVRCIVQKIKNPINLFLLQLDRSLLACDAPDLLCCIHKEVCNLSLLCSSICGVLGCHLDELTYLFLYRLLIENLAACQLCIVSYDIGKLRRYFSD